MKRQLLSRWKGIVDFVNEKKQRLTLIQILVYFREPTSSLYSTLTGLIPFIEYDYSCKYMDKLIPIIADIYFDNYELQQPKHMYQLSGISSDKGVIYLTLKNDYYTLQVWSDGTDKYQELTDEQFQEFLNQYHKFTADMFTRVEV